MERKNVVSRIEPFLLGGALAILFVGVIVATSWEVAADNTNVRDNTVYQAYGLAAVETGQSPLLNFFEQHDHETFDDVLTPPDIEMDMIATGDKDDLQVENNLPTETAAQHSGAEIPK